MNICFLSARWIYPNTPVFCFHVLIVWGGWLHWDGGRSSGGRQSRRILNTTIETSYIAHFACSILTLYTWETPASHKNSFGQSVRIPGNRHPSSHRGTPQSAQLVDPKSKASIQCTMCQNMRPAGRCRNRNGRECGVLAQIQNTPTFSRRRRAEIYTLLSSKVHGSRQTKKRALLDFECSIWRGTF